MRLIKNTQRLCLAEHKGSTEFEALMP
jgi:hypothetical protein